MEPYEPTSRRPIADTLRKTADGCVRLCVRCRIHPDAISYASIVAAALAGAGFYFAGDAGYLWLLLIAPVFCYLRLWLNMLDGMVALAARKASLRGEILNDLPDRASDVIIFAGLAHSGLCNLPLAYWTAIFALLTAYVGTFGQAVGVGRQFGGVMAKPWRMVAAHLGAWAAFAVAWFNQGNMAIGPMSVIDWTLALIIAGCVQTIAVRLKRIMTGLREADS